MLKFGTSGLRGLVTDMTDKECFINTRGFIAWLLSEQLIPASGKIVVAGDLRESTPKILLAVAAAIADEGCQVEYAGLCPTPALMYYAINKKRANIMVTGSHIPEDRNGIKFSKPDGEVLKKDEPMILSAVADIRRQVENNQYKDRFDQQGNFAITVKSLPAVNEKVTEFYKKRYSDFFPQAMLAGKRIVVDQHSAVGRDLLPELLETFGAQVIRDNRTGHFVAIDTENVTPEAEARFTALAEKHKPFAIVSTDGDSDRPFILDEIGSFYRGDLVGAIVADYLQADFAALPISANDAVDGYLHQKKIDFEKTKIGSPYVIAAMNEAKKNSAKHHIVGWEVNGGFMVGSTCQSGNKKITPLPTRDAMLPILITLAIATQKGSMSQVFEQMPRRYTQAGLLDNFPIYISQKIIKQLSPEKSSVKEIRFQNDKILVIDDQNQQTTQKIEKKQVLSKELFWQQDELDYEAIKTGLELYYFTRQAGFSEIAGINYIDGVRIYFSNQDIVHIRPSGNAPQLRLYANTNYQDQADAIIRKGLEDNGILRQMEKEIKLSL